MNQFRGEAEVHIGGEPRPIKFGTNQLAIYTQKHKIDLDGVNFGMAEFRDLLWSALVAGARKYGKPAEFDEWQVGEWMDEMDPAEFQKVIDCFNASMPKSEGETTEKK